jgi:hypothetical protein
MPSPSVAQNMRLFTLVSGVKENYTREGEIGSNVRHIEVINQGEYTYLCLHFIYIYV